MGVELAFGIAGGIILTGVLANLVAKKFGVPDIPLLIGLGILLGPMTGVIQVSSLSTLAPTFAALAIAVIVFEGGIHLRLARVAAQAGRATILAVGGYLLSVVFVGLTMTWLVGWPLIDGMLLGSALGGSSSAVVFLLLKRASPSEKTSVILALESSLTNVPVLVVTLSLIPLALGSFDGSFFTVFSGIFQSFSIGAVLGVVAGVVWLKMLDKMQDEPYKDIATLGFLLGAYAVSEYLKGSGAMCALLIGLIIGNGADIRKMAGLGEAPLGEGISKRFHEQISFALTTFFFVYLGFFFNLNDPFYFLLGGAIAAVLFVARYLAVVLSTVGNSILRMDSWVMTVMYPRGLSNAVMAQFFLTLTIPLAGPLVEVLLSAIFWSVVSSSLIVVFLPDHLGLHLSLPRIGGGRFPHVPAVKGPISIVTGFKASVSAVVASTLPGVKQGMGRVEASFGSYTPMVTYSDGSECVIFEAMMGQKDVGRIPTMVKACQDAKVAGALNFVIDYLTASRHLSRLLLVEEYCQMSRSLKFMVKLFTFDERKRMLVPIATIGPALKSGLSGQLQGLGAL